MKNFGKIFGISLLCLSPFFYTQTNAIDIPVARSGIDLNKSTIKITFIADVGAENAAAFTCFGETVATTANPITKTLAEIGVFDGSNPKDINRSDTPFDVIANIHNNDDSASSPLQDCFKAAGRYKTEVILSDAVGNKSDIKPSIAGDQPYTFDFIIKPGDVTNIKSDATDGSGSNCTDPKANGLDTCIIYTSLRDYADNNVYQINTGGSRSISADSSTSSSNNFPSFSSGVLMLKNSSSSWNLLPSGFVSGNYFSSAGGDRIEIRSIMPTVDNDGFTTIPKNISFTYSNLPIINKIGDLVTTTTNSTSFSANASIEFKKPVLVDIQTQPGTLSAAPADGSDDYQLTSSFTPLPNGESANFKDGSQRLKITASPNIVSNIHGNPDIKMNLDATDEVIYSRQIDSDTSKIIGKPGESNNIVDVNFSGNTTSVNVDEPEAETGNPNYNFSNIVDQVVTNNPLSKAIEYITNFFPANGAEGLTPNFDLKALVDYNVTVNNSIGIQTSKNVSYYAGSTAENSTDNALGVLIESNVITRDGDTKILANDLAVLTGLAKKDVRETITRNAFALARTAPNKRATSFNLNPVTDFVNGEVLIVQRKRPTDPQPNVKIGGQLPSGKKTLVIIDGNLLIDANTYYGNEANDSFGVILINTNPKKMPETGNIFVKNSVNNMRGTFFADGGILPSTASNYGQINNFASVDLDTDKQLRIVGSILTRNTIGGAGKAGSETALQTPWGDTTSIDEAKRYDLLYTRDAIATPDNCTHATNYNDPTQPPTSSSMTKPCINDDVNYEKAYSFILRFDRKVLEQSPPGFTTTQSVQQ